MKTCIPKFIPYRMEWYPVCINFLDIDNAALCSIKCMDFSSKVISCHAFNLDIYGIKRMIFHEALK